MLFAAALAAALPYVTGAVFGPPVPIASGDPGPGRGLWLEEKRLYVLSNDDLLVYSVERDPLRPDLLGRAGGVHGGRQVVVSGGIAYVSARERGMWIVDCRREDAPRVLCRYDTIGLGTGVDVSGNVCCLTQTGNGVEFIDVSDPARPQHICIVKTDESQSVVCRDGFVYSGEWANAHLTVLDARDLSRVREIAQCDFHGTGDGVWKDGRYLYCATGRHSAHTPDARPDDRRGPGLDVLDVSDPFHPRPVSRISYAPGFCRKKIDSWILRTSGSLLVSAQTCQGLYAVDIADPAHPKVLDRWVAPDRKPVAGMSGTEDCPGGAVSSVAIGDGVVYAAGPDFAPVALPCARARYAPVTRGAPPKNVAWRKRYPAPPAEFARWLPPPPARGLARACAVRGDICFAACSDAGLYALRFGGKQDIEDLGRLPPPHVFDVAVRGDRLYTAEGTRGWAIYRIDGEARLTELGRYARPGEPARDVWAYTDRWAVFSTRARCHLMDVSDPAAPRYLLSVQNQAGWDKYMGADVMGGRWLACNSALKHVDWIDLAAQPSPKVVRARESRLCASAGLCALGDRAFISNGGAAAQVAPGSDGPWTFTPFDGRGLPRSDGRFVACSLHNGRVTLHDFRDPARPQKIGDWNFRSYSDACTFWRGHLVIPCGYTGVLLRR